MSFKAFFFITILYLPFQAMSQLELRHIIRSSEESNLRRSGVNQDQDILQLPFWDDFSTSEGAPDSALWVDSENVLINSTMGSNPPTLNVATFDGTDATGNPYNIASQFVGLTDELTSKRIDLSEIVANRLNTVFLSFFWQARGNGELPNENDSLRLQFLSRDSVWVTQFVVIGGITALRTNSGGDNIFTQEILNVGGDEFLHEGFRFRFQSFGRLTGGFDTWHLDYIFLNQDRSATDLVYFDRGLTAPSSSLFGEYQAIPADQFFSGPEQFIDSLSFELFNLDALPHPIEYTADIFELVEGIRLNRTNEPTTAPLLGAFERREVFTNLPDLSSLTRSDSIVIGTEIIYNTGDQNLIQFINPVSNDTTFFDNVDYKVNDTIRQQFAIQDYLAYDDGTAEFAAGINQIRGQLAYQYFVPFQDTLTDIDIFFPRIAPSADGLPIEIIVWKRLSSEIGSILAIQPFTIQQQDELNEFTRFTLEIPVVVSDSIFIGWEQFSDNFIGVGLDKNTDTGDRIFINVDGEWRRNVGIEGSLMLRPVFRTSERSVVTSVEEEIEDTIEIYPNPGSGKFQVTGHYEKAELFDLTGQQVQFVETNSQFEILNKKPGIYLLRLISGGTLTTKKIIVR